MAFDPDKYLKKTESNAGFDPDKYLASQDSSGDAETAIMQGLQGATGGLLDEASGGLEAAGRVAGIKGLGGSFSDVGLSEEGPTLDRDVLSKAYEEARNKKRGILKSQQEESPALSTISETAGMFASPLNKLTKGMSLAKSGAALGGLNAFGGSEKEGVDLAVDTAVGSVLGGLLGKGVEKASPYIEKGIDKVSDKIGNFADKFAARALGAERGTIKSLGSDKVEEAGRYALDNGLLSPAASTADIIERNLAKKESGGKLMGDVYKAIDEAGGSSFNPLEVAAKVDDKLGGFYRSPINKGETKQLENTLESILLRGDKNIPLAEAQSLKQELEKVANWKNNLNITDKEKMAREAYGIVSGAIDDAVEEGAKKINSADLSGALKKGKELFSKASTAETLLENKNAREMGNKFIGLTDAIVGAGSLGYGDATGDWKTAAGIMAGKKALEKYGAQNAALLTDKISKSLMKAPAIEALAKKSPQLFQGLVNMAREKFMQQQGDNE